MSDARKILDERLAKGELSEEEYTRLAARLTPGAPRSDSAKAAWTGLKYGGAVLLFIIVLVFFFGRSSSSSLTVGNLQGRSSSVQLDIANTSSSTGDVLIWIERNGIEMCEHIFRMNANTRITNLSIPCTTGAGQFNVFYIWASSDRGRAAVARRIQVNHSD